MSQDAIFLWGGVRFKRKAVSYRTREGCLACFPESPRALLSRADGVRSKLITTETDMEHGNAEMEHGNTEMNQEAVKDENFEPVFELSTEELALIGGGVFTCGAARNY